MCKVDAAVGSELKVPCEGLSTDLSGPPLQTPTDGNGFAKEQDIFCNLTGEKLLHCFIIEGTPHTSIVKTLALLRNLWLYNILCQYLYH